MRSFKTLFTTFYSYKGGVGRTSALVNSALLRSIEGDRVVVIDFDLEAPGISSYVNELASRNGKKVSLDNRPGILEYLYEAINSDSIPDLKNIAITGDDLGLEIDGEIWFISAGDISDPEYTKKLSSLNWSEIFEKKQGALLLENLKRQIVSEFGGPDHVFIDSRTGITETGGVCTRYLANLVVVLSSLNDQNILGTSKVFNSFKKSNISTILVASNVPVGLPWGDNQLFTKRIKNFNTFFDSKPELLIYHYPSLSLKEYFPAYFKLQQDKSVLSDDPLLKSYENLSKNIDDKNPRSFNRFLSEDIVPYLFYYDSAKDAEFEQTLEFFDSHYSNRDELKKILMLMKKVSKAIEKDGEEGLLARDEMIDSLLVIKESEEVLKTSQLQMARNFMLDRASDELVSYYKKNKTKIRSPLKWIDVLSAHSKVQIVEILFELELYDIVFEKVRDVEEGILLYFAKGLAAEKIGNKKGMKESYELFINKINKESTEIEYAGIAFTCSYAHARIGNIQEAKILAERARELVESNSEGAAYLFIPGKYKHVKDSGEFLKELSQCEKELSKS